MLCLCGLTRLLQSLLRIGQCSIDFIQSRLRGFLTREFVRELHIELVVLFRILRTWSEFLLHQAFTAQGERGQLSVGIALIVRRAGNRLLGLNQLRARIMHRLHRIAML